MIQFFLDRDNTYTMTNYLGYRGASIRHLFRVTPYTDLQSLESLTSNTLIFTDLEFRNQPETKALIELCEYLESQGIPRVFNRPGRVLSRFRLLRTLFEKGINPHNVFLSNEPLGAVQFPVFIRHKDFHTGPLTALLDNHAQVQGHLRLLSLSGHRRDDLMIVEFVDARVGDGPFKKYSALKLGNHIIPRQLAHDDSWSVKSRSSTSHQNSTVFQEEFLKFMTDFPHREWVDQVFTIAGIDYGRIDYGIQDGRLVAWEINLNPDYGVGAVIKKRVEPVEIARSKAENHEQIREAFKELAGVEAREIAIPRELVSTKYFNRKRTFRNSLKYFFKKATTSHPAMKKLLQVYRNLLQRVLS